MRTMLVLAALCFAAACDGPATDGLDGGPNGAGYTLEIRAGESEQIYLVTSPAGETVAARAADGASALMDAAALRALMAAVPAPADIDARQEVVSLRLPGVNLSVSGDAEGKGESGRVSIDVAGHSVQVDADAGGPGDLDDRAHVRITGVPESEAREFIAKADQLSPAVQAQMLAALGLE